MQRPDITPPSSLCASRHLICRDGCLGNNICGACHGKGRRERVVESRRIRFVRRFNAVMEFLHGVEPYDYTREM